MTTIADQQELVSDLVRDYLAWGHSATFTPDPGLPPEQVQAVMHSFEEFARVRLCIVIMPEVPR